MSQHEDGLVLFAKYKTELMAVIAIAAIIIWPVVYLVAWLLR